MAVVGTAEIAVVPVTAGFATKLESQVTASGFSQKLEGQFANAGVLSGNSFTNKILGAFKVAGFGSAGLGVGLAVAAGVTVGLSKIGAEFGAVRNQIIKETGATAGEVAGLFTEVKTAALSVPASLGSIATAVDELFKRGVPLGAQLDKLAQQELFLAKITKTDLAANVESTTALFAKFNVPLAQQSRILDVLFKASQASGKGLQALLDPLQSGGAALQQFGLGIEQSAALIAGLQRAGVNAAPALAGLRLAFGKIAKEGGDPIATLHALLDEFAKAPTSAKAAADAIKLFGTRSGVELTTALQQGRFNVTALLKTITDGQQGIIATGQATLTLGDRFTLLKNRIADSLEGAGTAVRHAFSTIVAEASGPLSDLVASIVRFGEALGPALAPIGLVLVEAFKASLPVISAFSAGLNAIASVLEHLDPRILEAAGALGILVVGFQTLQAVLAAGGPAAFLADLNPVVAALVVAAAAVTALGAAIDFFGDKAAKAGGLTKSFRTSLFDTSNEAGLFKGKITDAATAFAAFVKTQTDQGKLPRLNAVLNETGTNIDQLADALAAGGARWTAYRNEVAAAEGGIKGSGFTIAQASVFLEKQAGKFNLAAQAGLRYAITAGQITRAQVDGLKATNRNADGTINWVRVVNGANAIVALHASRLQLAADKQNALATSTAGTNRAYGDLAKAVVQGTQSTADLEAGFAKLGFTTEGADAEIKRISDTVSKFVSDAVGQLPTVSTAFGTFASDLKTARDKLVADQQTQVQLQQQLATAGGKASKDLRDQILKNNQDIRDDFKTLADDQDPARFTKNLFAQVVNIVTFNASIKSLITNGFGSLASLIVQNVNTLGLQGAASLAAGFASSPAKAAAAEKVSELNDVVLAQAGAIDTKLGLQGLTSGQVLVSGIAAGVRVAAPALGQDLRRFGLDAGLAAGGGVHDGAVQALTINPPPFAKFGRTGGIDYGAGLAAGITESGALAITAADKVAADILAAQKNRFRASSPSKAAMEIGAFYSEGLALGIKSGGAAAAKAAAEVANGVLQATSKTFGSAPPVGSRLGPEGSGGLSDFLHKLEERQPPAGGILNGEHGQIGSGFGDILRRLLQPQAPPDAQTIAAIAQSLQVTGQSGLNRKDARDEFDRIAQAARPIEVNVTQSDADPLHIAAELSWALRR